MIMRVPKLAELFRKQLVISKEEEIRHREQMNKFMVYKDFGKAVDEERTSQNFKQLAEDFTAII